MIYILHLAYSHLDVIHLLLCLPLCGCIVAYSCLAKVHLLLLLGLVDELKSDLLFPLGSLLYLIDRIHPFFYNTLSILFILLRVSVACAINYTGTH